MKINIVEVEYADPDSNVGNTTQANLPDVARIEIRTGTGVSFILTPEYGELRIAKQGSMTGLTIRPGSDNVIRIS